MDAQRIAREEAAVAYNLSSDLPSDLTNHRWAIEIDHGIWMLTERDGTVSVVNVPAGG